MVRATLFILALLLIAVGCSKKIEDPLDDESPFSPLPAQVLSPVTDWVTIEGIAVRVDKVQVQKPIVEERSPTPGAKWRDRELEDVELVVWLQIENRTQTKVLYNGFGTGGVRHLGVSLVDEHDEVYGLRNHENPNRRLSGQAQRGTINPRDRIITEVLCFDRPSDTATTLTLTLPALSGNDDEVYEFELPAVVWKR